MSTLVAVPINKCVVSICADTDAPRDLDHWMRLWRRDVLGNAIMAKDAKHDADEAIHLKCHVGPRVRRTLQRLLERWEDMHEDENHSVPSVDHWIDVVLPYVFERPLTPSWLLCAVANDEQPYRVARLLGVSSDSALELCQCAETLNLLRVWTKILLPFVAGSDGVYQPKELRLSKWPDTIVLRDRTPESDGLLDLLGARVPRLVVSPSPRGE